MRFAAFVDGMSGKLRWRRGKDQPAVPGIHGLETQHVAQESTDLAGILGVNDGVKTGDHAETLSLMSIDDTQITPNRFGLQIQKKHLFERNFYLCIASRRGSIHGSSNFS